MAKATNNNSNEQTLSKEVRIVSLDTFLDIRKQSRAQKRYYQMRYGNPYRELSVEEWTKVTKLTEK